MPMHALYKGDAANVLFLPYFCSV